MTTEEIDKISLMRDEGKTTREIAEEFGVRVSTMRARLDRLIKAGEIGKLRPKMRWTDERVDELIRMKNSGATVEEMTKRFDVTFDAIRQKNGSLSPCRKAPARIQQLEGKQALRLSRRAQPLPRMLLQRKIQWL